MIKVRGLSKSFGDHVVLKDVNVEIKDGEILAILGESGAGKSVFLQHLIGLFRPDQGTVEIDGRDVTHLSERSWPELRKNMGYLFQQGALYDFMTVFENVAFPLQEHTSLQAREIKVKVDEILEMFGFQEAARKYPAELSGGMKKRAALARAVVLGSKIIFCDEPTSGLDPMRSRDISDLIQRTSRRLKCTTVITSHDVPNSFRIADRLVVFREGVIIAVGTQQELLASSDQFIKEFIK